MPAKPMQKPEEMIISVLEENGWSHEYKDNVLFFEVRLSNGRTQICAASVEDVGGVHAIDLRSVIGKLAEFPADHVLDLLEYNNQLVYARVEIDPTRVWVRVGSRTLLEMADAKEIELMIKEISANADILENRYYQRDAA